MSLNAISRPPVQLLLTAVVLYSSTLSAATISEYWLTAGDSIFVVQGSTLIRTITTPATEYPIAIADTVRTYAGDVNPLNLHEGREYNLGGTPTGVSYSNPGDFTDIWDGTTEGVNYNFSLQQTSGDIIRYDRNWGNGGVLFNAAPADFSWGGITFDTSNDSLWISSRGLNPEFRNYSLDGTLLNSFSFSFEFGPAFGWALAYEEQSDSLWVTAPGGGAIRNISKDGILLQSLLIDGLVGNILGGEMKRASISPPPVPVPATARGFIFLNG